MKVLVEVDGVKLEEVPASGSWPKRLRISTEGDGAVLLEKSATKLQRTVRQWIRSQKFARGETPRGRADLQRQGALDA